MLKGWMPVCLSKKAGWGELAQLNRGQPGDVDVDADNDDDLLRFIRQQGQIQERQKGGDITIKRGGLNLNLVFQI